MCNRPPSPNLAWRGGGGGWVRGDPPRHLGCWAGTAGVFAEMLLASAIHPPALWRLVLRGISRVLD